MSRSYEAYVTGVLGRLKAGEMADLGGEGLPVMQGATVAAFLVPVTSAALDRPAEVEHLARWRRENQRWFPERFPVTADGTKRWLAQAVLATPDRLLLWLKSRAGEYVGHLGLFRFRYQDRSCEVDNVVRGRADLLSGIMTPAVLALMDWAFAKLDLSALELRVMSDNPRALRLYERTGYAPVRQIPLYRKELADGTLRWVEEQQSPDQVADRAYTMMRYGRPLRLGPLRHPEVR